MNRTRSGNPRPRAQSGAARTAGAVVVAGLVAALVTGCGGDEPVRTPLTVEDLGPGDWAGPFADVEKAEVEHRASRCTALRPFFLSDEGGGITAEELSAWSQAETLVTVQVDWYRPRKSAGPVPRGTTSRLR